MGWGLGGGGGWVGVLCGCRVQGAVCSEEAAGSGPVLVLRLPRSFSPPPLPQSVQMFIDEKIGYLDIMKLNERCCEAHKAELVQAPNLEEIVHYDAWARRFVNEQVTSGAYKPRVVVKA